MRGAGCGEALRGEASDQFPVVSRPVPPGMTSASGRQHCTSPKIIPLNAHPLSRYYNKSDPAGTGLCAIWCDRLSVESLSRGVCSMSYPLGDDSTPSSYCP